MAKAFKIPPSQVRPIAVGFGSCYASDQITVDGRRVGFMYREAPDNSTDSGWRFFSGEESQEYTENPANFEIYDVNTIANYDPSITEFLEAPEGSAFCRNADGVFESEEPPVEPGA